MKFIKENKILLIICSSFILLTILLVLIINKEKISDEDKYVPSTNEYLHNYEVNEVVPVYVSEQDMAKKYLSDFVQLSANDLDRAYNMLDNDYKKSKFASFESFKVYMENMMSIKYLSANVKEYAIKSKGGFKYYYIIDSEGNNLVFKEKSIMNYTVFLDTYTIK